MVVLQVLWVLGLLVFGIFSLSSVRVQAADEPVSIASARLQDQSQVLTPQLLSFEARCEVELAPTSVTVLWELAEVSVDHTRSITELSKAGKSPQGNVTLGLTQAALGSQFSFGMETLTDPVTGRTCMRPQIAIRVSAGVQKISVAREFAKGSCGYQSVLDHEMQHVRANDDQAQFTSRRIEAEIRRSLGNRVFYGTRDELEGYLVLAVKDHWIPMARQSFAKVETDHGRIDRKSENLRVFNSCNGEVVRTVTASVI
ncbi:MAG: hypothetical protein RIR70_2055 [Pseudomonadota bacterium]|jgi:hypothetical protein